MRRRTSIDKQTLIERLEMAFEKKAWHGPNLRGTLRKLTPEEAAWRPGSGRHNIWELVMHCAYWKYAVRRQLTGEKRGSFPAEGSNWFKRPLVLTKEAWHEDLQLLIAQHRELLAVVDAVKDKDLTLRPGTSKYTRAFLIDGAAAHDLYHAGQIQLIKRLMHA